MHAPEQEAEAHVYLADVAETRDEAIAHLREAVRLQPDHLHYRILLAITEVRSSEPPDLPQAQQEKLEAAEADSALRVRLRPDDPSVRRNLKGLMDRVDYSRLPPRALPVTAYRELVKLRPTDAEAHRLLGEALVLRKEFTEASAELRESLRLSPGDAQAAEAVASILSRANQDDDVVEVYRNLARQRPDDAKVQERLGDALMQHKPDEAIAAYRTALRLAPDSVHVHDRIGNTLLAQKKLGEAVAEFREVAKRWGPFELVGPGQVGTVIGQTLLAQGKYEEGVAELKALVRLRPDHAEAQMVLGEALAKLGKLDEAETAYREAKRITPMEQRPEKFWGRNSRARVGLGEVLWKKGLRNQAITEFTWTYNQEHGGGEEAERARQNLERAAAELRTAIRLKPKDSTLYYLLGRSLRTTYRWRRRTRGPYLKAGDREARGLSKGGRA